MPKACVETVLSEWKSIGKTRFLYPSSTATSKYLTSQVFFIRRFYAYFTQAVKLFTQASSRFLLLLNPIFPHFPQRLLLLLNNY
jgi:protein involved in sex pheromone biosynthesis